VALSADTARGIAMAKKALSSETWAPTPLLPASTIGRRIGVELWLKHEQCSPIGSFKLRGGLATVEALAGKIGAKGVYVPSAGNYGQAISLAGKRRGIKVTVVAPETVTPSKVEKMEVFGATVIKKGHDFDAAKEWARQEAARVGAAFWEDGVIEEMAYGAATIATEIVEKRMEWDYAVIPIGNGSLMKGMAQVFRSESPRTRIIGLVPTGAPSMAYAVRGKPWDTATPIDSYADGLAVRVPIPKISRELDPLVDDIWMVEESKLLPAVKSLMELEQVMVEPSGASTLVGVAAHRADLAGKRVVAVLTGAHLRMSLLPEVLKVNGLV